MYCSSCGKHMGSVRMRCPVCGHFTSAFSLNLFSVMLWLVILEVDSFFLWKMIPIVAHMSSGLGVELPPLARLYIWLATVFPPWGLALLVVVVVVLLFILRWRKTPLPDFVKSGEVLAVVTWLALAVSLAGIFASFIHVLIYFPAIIK